MAPSGEEQMQGNIPRDLVELHFMAPVVCIVCGSRMRDFECVCSCAALMLVGCSSWPP